MKKYLYGTVKSAFRPGPHTRKSGGLGVGTPLSPVRLGVGTALSPVRLGVGTALSPVRLGVGGPLSLVTVHPTTVHITTHVTVFILDIAMYLYLSETLYIHVQVRQSYPPISNLPLIFIRKYTLVEIVIFKIHCHYDNRRVTGVNR